MKKRKIVSIIALALALIMLLGTVLPVILYADELSDLKQQLEDLKDQQVAVYNENNFTNLNEYSLNWSLTENGKEIGSGTVAELPSVRPKQAGTITIPYSASLPETLMPGGEYRLYVELVTKDASWGVKAGHEIAHEQFDLSDDVLTSRKGRSSG